MTHTPLHIQSPALRSRSAATMLYRLALSILFIAFVGNASSAQILVDDDRQECPGAQYTTIQAALANAISGQEIVICPGVYNESLTINQNNMTLRGLTGNRNDVLIQIDDHVVTITNSPQRVELHHLTLVTTRNGRHGLRVASQHASGALVFANLSVTAQDTHAIRLEQNSSNVTISDSFIRTVSKGDAIRVERTHSNGFRLIGTTLNSRGLGLHFRDTVNHHLDIDQSKITAKDEAVYFDKVAVANVVIQNSSVNGKSGIYFNNRLEGDLTLGSVKITSHTDHGIYLHERLQGSAEIRLSEVRAAKRGIHFRREVTGRAVVEFVSIASRDEAIYFERSARPEIVDASFLSTNKAAGLLKLAEGDRIAITGSCFTAERSGEYALDIDISNSPGAVISGNCFYAQALNRLARAKGTNVGHAFDGNFWNGLVAGSYSLNNVSDTSPQASCPFMCGVIRPPSELDHIRILHNGQALTCVPATISLLACEDADCETLYADEITVTLTPSGWVGGDTISFMGGAATAQLRRTTPGVATLGVEESAPVADSAPRCFNGVIETCALGFAEAGFVVEVPDLIANRPDGPVTLRAVKQADDGVSCAPAFSGPRTVSFWTDYENPNGGTMPVQLNGAPIATSAPGTGVALDFDASAVATIAGIRYADAGQMRLNVRFVGAGDETGLVLEGSDLFVSRPLGLAVLSSAANADCASANPTCSVFRRAGEDFDLTVRGVAWTHDGDTDLNDNPVTPNYRQNGIALGHTLIAPLPGIAGTIGQSSVVIGNSGETIITQRVSEVGVFRFNATPQANAYFGYTVTAGESANIGRFIPQDFSLSLDQPGLLPSACSAFSYSGQSMDGWIAAPRITIQPRNLGGAITTNYRADFMRLLPAGLTFALPSEDDSATGLDGTLLPVTSVKQVGTLDDLGGGASRYTFSENDRLTYERSSNARVAPFVGNTSWRLTALVDQDGVLADGLPFVIQPAGTEIRYGRLALEPAHGSERTDLLMTAHAEHWSGFTYAANTLDFCTPAPAAGLACTAQIGPVNCGVVVEGGGTLAGGRTQLTLRAPNATGTLRYTLTAPPWLRFDWNNDGIDDAPSAPATFGIYEGNPNMIHMREIWR